MCEWQREKEKARGDTRSRCCPQQPNLSSSALLMMGPAGTGLPKTPAQQTHTHTLSLSHTHTQTKIVIHKRYKETVWGKNSPSPFPAIRGLLFQHLVATGLRSECWAAQTKEEKLIPFTSSALSVVPWHFIALFLHAAFLLCSLPSRVFNQSNAACII